MYDEMRVTTMSANGLARGMRIREWELQSLGATEAVKRLGA